VVLSGNKICESKILSRNDTVGTTGIPTPVETSTSVSNSHGLVISAVIEAGSQPL
jgi:hypothetical protein